jgi:hypothetical protein
MDAGFVCTKMVKMNEVHTDSAKNPVYPSKHYTFAVCSLYLQNVPACNPKAIPK